MPSRDLGARDTMEQDQVFDIWELTFQWGWGDSQYASK